MFSPESWKRADLIPMLVIVLAISLCCPILFALDDEDNDLPDVILPSGGGGGSGGGGSGGDGPKSSTYPPGNVSAAQANLLPWGFTHNVALVVNATKVGSYKVPLASNTPGFHFEANTSSVCLTICRAGSPGEPQTPDARILVSGYAGEKLTVLYDDCGCTIRDRFIASTTLEEIESDLFNMTIHAGLEAVRGVAFYAVGDLQQISAANLLQAIRDGRVENKTCRLNMGAADFTKVVKIVGENLRNEVFDFGMVQVGFDENNEVVSVTSAIVRARPNGVLCPVEIEVNTTD